MCIPSWIAHSNKVTPPRSMICWMPAIASLRYEIQRNTRMAPTTIFCMEWAHRRLPLHASHRGLRLAHMPLHISHRGLRFAYMPLQILNLSIGALGNPPVGYSHPRRDDHALRSTLDGCHRCLQPEEQVHSVMPSVRVAVYLSVRQSVRSSKTCCTVDMQILFIVHASMLRNLHANMLHNLHANIVHANMLHILYAHMLYLLGY